LGAYGDALGAPHELDSSSSGALRGCVGIPDTVLKLPPVGDYTASPWGVWVETKQGDDLRGLPTDDTSYRVTLLHQWLSQLARTDDAPTEARFLSWLRAEDKPNADAALWKTLRHRQISDWIVMFQDADRLRRDPPVYVFGTGRRRRRLSQARSVHEVQSVFLSGSILWKVHHWADGGDDRRGDV